MKVFKLKQSKDISLIQGGFSDVRLWPCYLVFSGSILFFAPQIGTTLSVFIFSSIGLVAMLYAASRMPALPTYSYDFDKYILDINLADTNNQPMPDLKDYLIVTPAKVKQAKPKKTAKRLSLRPYLDLRAKVKTGKTSSQSLATY